MASKDDNEGLVNTDDMMRELQLLELQEKRMRKLVEQRREERKGLELENSRMQRQKKYMEEMAQENEDWEEEYSRQMAAKGSFGGTGHMPCTGSSTSQDCQAGAACGGGQHQACGECSGLWVQ